MARTRKGRSITGVNMPIVQGIGRRYQTAVNYGNSLLKRPSRYATSFKSDPRFPVLDDTGHAITKPADHQTEASRRGGDRVKPNHGAGTPERTLL